MSWGDFDTTTTLFVARDRQRGRGRGDLAKIEDRPVSLLMSHG